MRMNQKKHLRQNNMTQSRWVTHFSNGGKEI